jgi:NADPH:quinone reductase
MSTDTKTMKAVMLVPGPDGADITVREVPRPAAERGQVLVAVHAAALNRGELMTRRNLRSGSPQSNGIEFAGEVVELGAGVDPAWLGLRVMGHWRAGQAEFVAVDPRLLVPVPDRLDWVHAGAWLNVFTTAHDALVTRARLQPGESVLVNAAGSGIGTAALQIARLLGANPILGSTRSAQRRAQLGRFGMQVGIDAAAPAWPQAVREATGGRGVNVIIDSVGPDVLAGNLECIALEGRLVSIGRLGAERGEIDMDQLAIKRATLIGVTFRTRTLEERAACVQRCAADLLAALADGRIEPVLDRVFPLEAIRQAHDYLAGDSHLGKVVLQVRP